MSGKLKLYGDPISGNCLKTKWTADYLGLDYEWVPLDILKGETRTEEFLAINPFGQIPIAVFADGSVLTQSNAIAVHLAESVDRGLLPKEPVARARVFQWLFWEQNSHEPYIAGRRFRKSYLKHDETKIDAEWLPRGNAALKLMDDTLQEKDFLTGADFTLADIVLVAYTRVAHEGGFDPGAFAALRDWIARVEQALGIQPVEAA